MFAVKIIGIVALVLIGMFLIANGLQGEGTNWISLTIGAACQGVAAMLYPKMRQAKNRA